jgi:hypothetical protein
VAEPSPGGNLNDIGAEAAVFTQQANRSRNRVRNDFLNQLVDAARRQLGPDGQVQLLGAAVTTDAHQSVAKRGAGPRNARLRTGALAGRLGILAP